MKTIRKYYDMFFQGIEIICVLFQGAIVLILAYGVFMRHVINNSPRWTDEISLFCMIWFSLLGAAVALKENRHIRIQFWNSFLPPKVMKGLELIVHVIVFIFLLWFLKYAIALTNLTGSTKLTGSGIPMKYLYVSEPVAVGCMIIAAIGRVGEIIGSKS